MPQLKLGNHSNAWTQVAQAFESEIGLPGVSRPLGTNADHDWLVEIVGTYNEKNNTNIEYSHEDYGYWFRYGKPEEAMLLGELKEKYGL